MKSIKKTIISYIENLTPGQKLERIILFISVTSIYYNYSNTTENFSKLLENAAELSPEMVAKLTVANMWFIYTIITVWILFKAIPIIAELTGKVLDKILRIKRNQGEN